MTRSLLPARSVRRCEQTSHTLVPWVYCCGCFLPEQFPWMSVDKNYISRLLCWIFVVLVCDSWKRDFCIILHLQNYACGLYLFKAILQNLLISALYVNFPIICINWQNIEKTKYVVNKKAIIGVVVMTESSITFPLQEFSTPHTVVFKVLFPDFVWRVCRKF